MSICVFVPKDCIPESAPDPNYLLPNMKILSCSK